MLSLHFVIPRACPRLRYLCKQVFERPYGITCSFIIDASLSSGFYIVKDASGREWHKAESGIFFTETKVKPSSFDWKLLKQGQLVGDWMGALFYLLSRMEEYDSQKDIHGRFSAQHAVATQEGFLDIPLVEFLAAQFVKSITGDSPRLDTKVLPTLDIDMTHAIKGRSIGRQTALLLRDLLHWDTFKQRVRVLTGKEKDAFDNFDYQQTVFDYYGLGATYFFQVGDYSQYDKNISVGSPLFRHVLASISASHSMGLHPSYYTLQKAAWIAKEKQRLEQVTQQQVWAVRFHFLRFNLPLSYRELLSLGITEEHSMGYSDCIGFRASTARPFYWFDLEKNCETKLKVVPFCVMDVALQHFMQLDVEQAIASVQQIKKRIAEWGGVFSFCFHNESLSEMAQWRGWRRVFEEACKPVFYKQEGHL